MTNQPSKTYTVSPRTRVRITASDATVAPLGLSGVLGDDDERPPVGPFTEFVDADTPFKLELDQPSTAPSAADRAAAPVAVVDHMVTGEERADFSYILLHEVRTPDGVVYEVTLPLQPAPGVLADDDVALGPTTLRFTVKRFMDVPKHHGAQPGGDSGVLGDDAPIVSPFQHIAHILKAPITGAIDAIIARTEAQPTPLRVAADGTLQPLGDAEAWRHIFDDLAGEQRVLIFIHGFLSDSNASLPRAWLPWLRERYDAILAYTHPTLTRDPLTNVIDLIKRIPPDLRLTCDLVSHSRGGLVARSLVELAPQVPQVAIDRLLTCGSPHNGTPLARVEQWDKLASIMLTATSWLLTTGGASWALALVPKLLEQILKAGSQHFFNLPGVNALVPGNDFLTRLNAANTPPVAFDNRYAAVASTFKTESILQAGFSQALQGLVAQSFIGAPNDLIVPTKSMNAIDLTKLPFAGKHYDAQVNHFGYFDEPAIEAFAQLFLSKKEQPA